jgi:hypothetical protein
MSNACYLLTKTFTKGILEGITITEKTTVEFVVGKTYKACVGSTEYRVVACEKEVD